MPKRELTEHERRVAALAASAIKAVGQHKTPIAATRQCCRCESLAAKAHDAGTPIPPVYECESWLSSSRRYWAGTCRGCSDLEWAEIWQRHYDSADDCPKEQRRLSQVAQDREKRGRKVPLRIGPKP
jgi:hypothetical protein